MEISGVHQHQAMEPHLDKVLSCNKSQQQQEKKPRPQPEQALKCPRCDSTNTKFCYYNNYSLSQPRYFCKGCRRYWTKGGSLRNVPVGGGCRKNNKRSSSSSSNSPSSSSTTSSKKSQDQDLTTNSNPFLPPLPLPPLPFDPNDLTLAFASLQNQPTTIVENNDHFMLANPNPNSNPNTTFPFLDILRGGYVGNSPSASFQSMYYGFGGNIGNANGNVEEVEGEGDAHMVFSLDGGPLNSSRHVNSTGAVTATATTAASTNEASGGDHGGGDNKVATGLHQWQLGLGDDNMIHANLGLDSTRDYWNGVGTSSWRGIINSSLM